MEEEKEENKGIKKRSGHLKTTTSAVKQAGLNG